MEATRTCGWVSTRYLLLVAQSKILDYLAMQHDEPFISHPGLKVILGSLSSGLLAMTDSSLQCAPYMPVLHPPNTSTYRGHLPNKHQTTPRGKSRARPHVGSNISARRAWAPPCKTSWCGRLGCESRRPSFCGKPERHAGLSIRRMPKVVHSFSGTR